MPRLFSLLLFFIFCAAGIGAGLAIAWLVAPAQPSGVTPERLNPTDRELYIQLVADSFAADGNRVTAASRLGSLGSGGEEMLVKMIERDLTGGGLSRGAENLIGLAVGVGIDAGVIDLLGRPPAITPATPSASSEGESIAAPATPVGAGRFELVEQAELCAAGEDANRIEIQITGSDGRPQGGVPVTVYWDGGQDSFFTGFSTGRNAGYADFKMARETTYSVAVGGDEVSVAGLATQLCADGRDGGWRLEYLAREP